MLWFAAAVESRAAGAAPPRILVTLLLPLLAIHTLPPRSMAMPLGEESEESVNPPEGDSAVPALLNRLLPGGGNQSSNLSPIREERKVT